MKKFLALLLCVCMLMHGTVSFAASKAAEQEFSTDSLAGEIVIENPELSGEGWSDSTLSYAHKWTNVKGATATWEVEDIKAGNYEVYFWLIPHKNDAVSADMNIDHNGKHSAATLYFKLNVNETVDAGWVSFGVYDFAKSGDQKIYLTCDDGNIRATKVRLVPTKKEITAVPAKEADDKEDVKETETSISNEGVVVIGNKKPDSSSQLKDISVAPTGSCTWEGNWTFSSAVSGPMADHRSTLWIAGVGEEAYVAYKPDIEAVGDVNIFVYLLYWHENQNPNVKYEIYHNGKVDTVMLDPTTLTESSWVYLGTFDFAGKPDEEYVKLVAQPSEVEKHNTRASTMMFEIVNSANGGIWQTKYLTPSQSIESVVQAAKLAPLDKFSDMVSHWANYDVEYMANEGLISGVSENAFNPEAQITRAEYLTILNRAMGYEISAGETFSDVSQDAWYAPYIATAKTNGLLNGLPTDDGFKPEQPVTREEMCLFTYNAIKQIGRNDEWLSDMPDDFAKFEDAAEISDWATDAVKYLIKTGIIKGMTETTVAPKGNATRAQGAVILKRFMQMFVWAGPPTDQEWVLKFNDEFNGTEMDWGVWRSDASAPGHILSSRWPENVEVHDGAVHLMVKKEQRGGKEWTAASVWVRSEVFAQTYGYWEARYKIAAAPGINNSFWSCTDHVHNVHMDPDPTAQYEIDVNEGHYPDKVNMNYHTTVTGERKQHSESYSSPYDLSADYHTYALEWTPTELKYYHDGKLMRVQENYNAHQHQFPYLSSAVLNWAGSVTNDADGTAQIVDYVRIWQKKELADDEKLNYKGEPLVGVGPSEAGNGIVSGVSDDKVSVLSQEIDSTEYPDEIIITPEVEGDWKESVAIKNYNDGAHLWTKGLYWYPFILITPGLCIVSSGFAGYG